MQRKNRAVIMAIACLVAILAASCAEPADDSSDSSDSKTDKIAITFNANGGTGEMAKQRIPSGTSAALTANAFTRSGCDFQGWAADSNATVAAWADKATYKTGNADVTLFAVWAAAKTGDGPGSGGDPGTDPGAGDGKSYTITFDSNAGSGTISSQKIAPETSAILLENKFSRTGYAFLGWSTDKEATTHTWEDGATYAMGTDNVTLFAVWVIPPASRELTEDETWSGHVTVLSDIYIYSGCTLTIAPGTVVSVLSDIDEDETISISVYGGKLIANGTKSAPITIRSDTSYNTDSDWDNISIAAGTLSMDFCIVENASTGVFCNSGTEDTISITNSCFTNCDSGITIFSSVNTLKNITFDNCFYGFSDGSGMGNTLSNCEFINNSDEGITIQDSNTTLLVQNSNFASNDVDVEIYDFSDATPCHNATITLQHCYPASPSQRISETADETCEINITSPAASKNADSGCGFSYTAY